MSTEHKSALIKDVWHGDISKTKAQAVFLTDGTKISIARKGMAAWLTIGPAGKIVLCESKPEPPFICYIDGQGFVNYDTGREHPFAFTDRHGLASESTKANWILLPELSKYNHADIHLINAR